MRIVLESSETLRSQGFMRPKNIWKTFELERGQIHVNDTCNGVILANVKCY